MKYRIFTKSKKLLSDTVTPVGIYLKIRDRFPNSILLESSDYHGNDNSFSFICAKPIAHFKAEDKNTITIQFPELEAESRKVANRNEFIAELDGFKNAFSGADGREKCVSQALFGYLSYESVSFFEDLKLESHDKDELHIPLADYRLFRFVIAINHFKNELEIFDNQLSEGTDASGLELLETIIQSRNIPSYHFHLKGTESSNFTNEQFLEVLKQGQKHCFLGDVFQIVLSRRFKQSFSGDEFNVYRTLRSINPSPYLFYFDYGDFKLFGSSPEAQIVIKDQQATIFPIAGTFRRSGLDSEDEKLAIKLVNDPKESAEHVMLVDLARNDLSRNCTLVEVEKYKEIQFYSHVIHLVSKVTGTMAKDVKPLDLVADTFPAGTLSGAPKYKAMQIIDKLEASTRNFYAGAIGMLHLDGDFNHAIIIRSFLSKGNTLVFQAGAGVVAKSVPESELEEVNNKLSALRAAMVMAETI